MAAVLAGPSKEMFVISEYLLRQHSTFFDKELSDGGKEAEKCTSSLPPSDGATRFHIDARVVELLAIEACYFKVYYNWAMEDKLVLQSLKFDFDSATVEDLDPDMLRETDVRTTDGQTIPSLQATCGTASSAASILKIVNLRRSCDRLCRLWIHGGFLGDPLFQNAVMSRLVDATFRTCCFWLDSSTLHHVYRSTPEGSPLRKWAVDVVVWRKQYLAVSRHGAPSAYVSDLLQRILQREKLEGGSNLFQYGTHCEYHIHDPQSDEWGCKNPALLCSSPTSSPPPSKPSAGKLPSPTMSP